MNDVSIQQTKWKIENASPRSRLARRCAAADEAEASARILLDDVTQAAQRAEAVEKRFRNTYGASEAQLRLLSSAQMISTLNYDLADRLRHVIEQLAQDATATHGKAA